MEEFGENLFKAIDEWKERTGGHCQWTIMHSLVDDEPIEECAAQHRGPQSKIILVMTDMKRSDEFAVAYYGDHDPIEIPCLNQTDREIKLGFSVSNREPMTVPVAVPSWEGTE